MKIQALARLFRDALTEAVDRADPVMGAFPVACCGSASEMFGLWLSEHRGITSEYVHAERSYPEFWTHAWLRTEPETIVDLTCDAFSEWKAGAPYVGAPSLWHCSWNVVSVVPVLEAAEQGREHWEETYERVVKALANVRE